MNDLLKRFKAWMSSTTTLDPMDTAGELALVSVAAGAFMLWGAAVALIVFGVLLGAWYCYLELYIPNRRPRGKD